VAYLANRATRLGDATVFHDGRDPYVASRELEHAELAHHARAE
jgi:hypothetical protein